MNNSIEINYQEEPAWKVIGGGNTDFSTHQAVDDKGKNLYFALEDSEGEVLGGVIGMT